MSNDSASYLYWRAMMPTKEQVLKRMAQIEGLIKTEGFINANGWYWHINRECFVQYSTDEMLPTKITRSWNPLHNPSDWAVLIEKYRPNLFFLDSEYFSKKYRGKWTAEIGSVETVHESLPWAICLAIIESKGGMGDE